MEELAQMGKVLKIGFDFDETYTAKPEMMDKVIQLFKSYGCLVKFVTIRCNTWDNRDIIAAAKKNDIEIVFCNGEQKAGCFKADIWIDDSPEMIPTYAMSGGLLIPTTCPEELPDD